MSTPEQLMYRFFGLRDELNGLVLQIPEVEKIFDQMTLNQPCFVPTELGFVRSVSWLYGLYYEAGKIGVSFLLKNLNIFGIDNDGRGRGHYEIVRNLRTFNFHNLNRFVAHDKRVVSECQKWFREGCGTFVPTKEEDWAPLIIVLLSDSVLFLERLRDCLRHIELEEEVRKVLIYEQWQHRVKRYHPPHKFDEIIPEILEDMGRSRLDPIRFREKYYSDWVRVMEAYIDGYNFNDEARRLIENSVLAEGVDVLPISGRDLIDYFELEPGPEIGDLLQAAKVIFGIEKCDKDTLLTKLRAQREEKTNSAGE
ncbi:HD domain-containing protein [Burkholderia cepacia]|uniref:hypothetical protein n=1 Tax=Burkholderia cepacia TaxID=292 RepID=UPI002ABE7D9C|nr:hypothetical protein [Burkholderia cepacia]